MRIESITKYAVIAMLAVCWAFPSHAVLTLPIADDANTDAGTMRLGAGVTLESDLNLYGGRFTYGVADGIALFAGGGIADPDGMDNEPFIQLGGQVRLPLDDLPFDVALRAAFGMVSFEEKSTFREGGFVARSKVEIDVWMLNAGVLVSAPIEMFTVYGLIGVSYAKTDVKGSRNMNGYRESFSDDDTDTELAIGAGVIFPLNDQLSFYGELMYIDDPYFSFGGRYDF